MTEAVTRNTAVWAEESTFLLSYFKYDHLPPHLQAISKPFHDLAHDMADKLGKGHPEVVAGIRKLVEAKDCLVRANLKPQAAQPPGPPSEPGPEEPPVPPKRKFG